VSEPNRPTDWRDWYRFARETLAYEHDEAIAYANLRYVEEQNRRARSGGEVYRELSS
jgi:hypothetical protein